MASLRTIYSSNLFTLVPQLNLIGQFCGVSIITSQRDFTLSLGYVGDEKDRGTDFTEILEFREIVVKSCTNEDKTVLKSVAVFSKYKMPFQLVVDMRSTPPLVEDEVINKKYIEALAGLSPTNDTYALLLQNPDENPMVPEVEFSKRLGRTRVPPENGLVDLRKEITHRVNNPFINDKS